MDTVQNKANRSSRGMRIRERNVWWRLIGQLLFGLGLLMVLPFVVAAIIPLCIMLAGDHLTDEYGKGE
jgi:hypothetical protein